MNFDMISMTDAISVGDDAVAVGFYKDYILKTAYQPIYGKNPIRNDQLELLGYEGLIRPTKDGKTLNPHEFFEEVDEEDRLFVECLSMAVHIQSYRSVTPKDRLLFININAAHYPCGNALEAAIFFIFSQLSQNNLDNGRVVFEILETEVIDLDVLSKICNLLRTNGYRFALDDFGTQFSNIDRYLTCRPDIVKLDRSLFQNFGAIPETASMLNSIIKAFIENGTNVLIEGIETEEEVDRACSLSFDLMQGFGLSRPKALPAVFEDHVKLNTIAKSKAPALKVIG